MGIVTAIDLKSVIVLCEDSRKQYRYRRDGCGRFVTGAVAPCHRRQDQTWEQYP